jgi:hypothetical protein
MRATRIRRARRPPQPRITAAGTTSPAANIAITTTVKTQPASGNADCSSPKPSAQYPCRATKTAVHAKAQVDARCDIEADRTGGV